MDKKITKHWPGKPAICLVFFLMGWGHISPCQETDHPNIILFYVDDLGWSDLGYTGSVFYESPTIDLMAAKAMIFTNAYANAPNCAPSRASLLSGLYTPRHGVYTVAPAARGKSSNRKLVPTPTKTELSPSFPTIANMLQQHGYETAQIGKWHLGKGPSNAVHQGFDISSGGTARGYPPSYFSPYKIPGFEDGSTREYLTDRLTDEALRFIEDQAEQPFFLYLSHYAVHTPLQAKEADKTPFSDKNSAKDQDNITYAAMIRSVDRSMARIESKLKDLQLTEKTLIIFYSDNGGLGSVTSNKPLKGEKGMLYEGGIRVPMFWYWPGKIKPHTVCNEPVIGIDIFPTLMAVAGVSAEDLRLDGEDLTPLLFEKGMWEQRSLYWHFPAYLQGTRSTKYPQELVRGWRAVPSGAIRKGDWKLIEDFETGELFLYNLTLDISEKENLALKNPTKLYELKRELKNWRKEMNARAPAKINSDYFK
ncbi:sulfatase [Fulvivirga sp. M361]|uniref:sulfatase n=1 Tax=Fulvivirga sp. M361 TaxID=2594266 RepID=UPI00117A3150|nr:sulfatase [Fulvivirga sp. M361]TRX49682.1 sulfatase [Fulvivirga sp. M361]